jgi:hypothetical protein
MKQKYRHQVIYKPVCGKQDVAGQSEEAKHHHSMHAEGRKHRRRREKTKEINPAHGPLPLISSRMLLPGAFAMCMHHGSGKEVTSEGRKTQPGNAVVRSESTTATTTIAKTIVRVRF